MAISESPLARSWRQTESTRASLAWWIVAVVTGATLAVAGYFIAPDEASVLFAFGGVVIGFFAPYVAALVWNLPKLSARQSEVTRPR